MQIKTWLLPGGILAVYDAGPPELLVINAELDVGTRQLIVLCLTKNPPMSADLVFINRNDGNNKIIKLLDRGVKNVHRSSGEAP